MPCPLLWPFPVPYQFGDDILRKFWELEERPTGDSVLSLEERAVVKHFSDNFTRTDSGRFVVPLPDKTDVTPLSESLTQAVRRFLSLELSLLAKGRFKDFEDVMSECFDTEPVPEVDLQKPPEMVFYLPVHLV